MFLFITNDLFSFQEDALEAIQQIEIGGVTNLSAGIFMAMDQFVYKAIGIKIKG